ncbi:hypothetical protein EPK90_24430 (plasmid) [Pantoea ananatis]|nr:hypothetical protein EPK90_24430 [Pantoea ananatis]
MNALATGNWQLATGNWQLATGNWQLATGNWQLATGRVTYPVFQRKKRGVISQGANRGFTIISKCSAQYIHCNQ